MEVMPQLVHRKTRHVRQTYGIVHKVFHGPNKQSRPRFHVGLARMQPVVWVSGCEELIIRQETISKSALSIRKL